MKKIKKVSEGKQTFWLAFGKILALLANIAIPLFLTRVLNKDEYGFYSQFNTVLYFLVGFFSFTMASNLYFFFPTIKESKKRVIIFQTILFLVISSSLSAIFIYIPYISDFIMGSESLRQYKIIIYFLTIILIFTDVIQPLYVVKKDIKISIWFPAIQIILKAFLIIVFFLIIPGIQSIINAIIVSSFLIALIVLRYVIKTVKKLPGKHLLNKTIAIDQLKYNLPIGVAVSLKTFAQRFDKLISISLLSTSAYASYAVAFFGIPGIKQIYSSISQVTVVSMAKSFEDGDVSEALSSYKKMVVKNLSFSIPVILGVCLNARQIIIFLFTDKYADATILFQMHLFSIVFVMLGEGLIMRASGNTKFYSRIYMLLLPVILPSTYFLVKYFGSMGAMSGSLISIILPRLFLIRKEIQITDSTLRTFFPWKRMSGIILVSVLSLIPFAFLKSISGNNIFFILFILIMYLIFVFFIEIKLNIFIIDKERVVLLRKKYLKF